jgi:hypothetical protein
MATSTSAAQINGDVLASDTEPGQGNSSAPDRCCIALKARPVNMKNICVPESDAALDAAGAESDGIVPFVRAMLSVYDEV